MNLLDKAEIFAWGAVFGVGLAQSIDVLLHAIDKFIEERKKQ